MPGFDQNTTSIRRQTNLAVKAASREYPADAAVREDPSVCG
jgi:hypothetical protein